jgi:hypothetical protein
MIASNVTAVGLSGQFIVINQTYNNGRIRFSFIDMDGIDVDQSLISITFTPINDFIEIDSSLSVNIVSPVDKNFQAISLNVPTPLIKISFIVTSFIVERSSLAGLVQNSFISENNSINLFLGFENSIEINVNDNPFNGIIDFNSNEFSYIDNSLICLEASVYTLFLNDGSISIQKTSNVAIIEEAFIQTATIFANLLIEQTDGVNICDTNGLLESKVDVISLLVTEYLFFPDSLLSILNPLPSSNSGSTVIQTMQILINTIPNVSNSRSYLRNNPNEIALLRLISTFLLATLITLILKKFYFTNSSS